MKSPILENCSSGKLSKPVKKSIFYVKNHSNLYGYFFSLKTINLGAQFLLNINFFNHSILKWCPIFESLPFNKFSNKNSRACIKKLVKTLVKFFRNLQFWQKTQLKYQYSIWRILNKYQYGKKTEVSVFSISILSGKKCEKNNKPSKCEKLRFLLNRH